MNLRAVDLNLLVILDALLDEAHVSRAAQRLNLSQPAVSSALQRCRDLFGDPLLERGGGGMTRTVKAEALRAPLKTLLGQVTDLLDPPEIPLAEIARTLRIITADDPLSILAAPLVARLQATAPGITLVFQPWRGAMAATRHLMDGDADLAISVFDAEAEALRTVTLLEEDYVVAMRRGHPAAVAFGLDAWLAHPHVVVSGRGEARSALDRALAALGRERRVGLVMPSFQMVPRVLAASDFIAMMPRHSPALREPSGLVTFAPPLVVPGFPLHLAWHERHAKDAAVQHVRAEIAAIFAALPPVSGAT